MADEGAVAGAFGEAVRLTGREMIEDPFALPG